MAPSFFTWRRLSVCAPHTSISSNTFIYDFLRLSQIKKELVIPILIFKYF